MRLYGLRLAVDRSEDERLSRMLGELFVNLLRLSKAIWHDHLHVLAHPEAVSCLWFLRDNASG
jgi:hypothetical protein